MNSAGYPANTVNSAFSAIPPKVDSMVDLPPEILLEIAKLVSACRDDEERSMRKASGREALEGEELPEYHPISSDVLKFRLVCKVFGQIGLTTLVDFIHHEPRTHYKTFMLKPTLRCLEALEAIACNKKLRNIIEIIELKVGPLEMDVMPLSRYVSGRSRRAKAADHRVDLPRAMIAQYSQYLDSRRQTQAFVSAALSAKGLQDLSASLRNLPRLTMLSVDKHSAVYPINGPKFYARPDFYTFGEPRWKIAHFLLQAASAAEVRLQSLVIGNMDRYFFEPAPVPDFTGPILHLFSSLTRITINMAWDKAIVEHQDIHKWADALAAAHDLEELDLAIDNKGHPGKSIRWTTGVLRHQHWTKLRLIRLRCVCIRWEELDAMFKRHSHSLCTVQFMDILLRHGGWRFLLFNMRETLSLKSAFLMIREFDLKDLPDGLIFEDTPDIGRYLTKERY